MTKFFQAKPQVELGLVPFDPVDNAMKLHGDSAGGMLPVPGYDNVQLATNQRMPALPNNDQGYALAVETVTDIAACVLLRAETINAIPIQVVKKGTDIVVEDSPWHQSVNQARDRFFQKLIFKHEWALAIWGVNYELKLVQPDNVTPGGLQWLNPLAIEPEIQEGILLGYQYNGGGSYEMFSRHQVGYDFTENTQSDIQGSSPIGTCLTAANIKRNSGAYIEAFFANDATPGGLITGRAKVSALGGMPVAISAADRKDIIAQWNAQVKGARKAHSTIMLPWDLEYTQFDNKPPTEQVALTDDQRKDMHQALRVPMTLTGAAAPSDPLSASATLENDRAIWWDHWAIPEHKNLMKYYNTVIMPWLAPGLELRGDYSELEALISNTAERRTDLRADVTAGLITPNQYLEATNREPFEGGDVLYLPVGVNPVPIGSIGASDEPVVTGDANEIAARNKVVIDQMRASMIDVFTAAQMLGRTPSETLRGMYWVGDQLVPEEQITNIWKYGTLIAPSTTNADLIVESEPSTLPTDEVVTELPAEIEGNAQEEPQATTRSAIVAELEAWKTFTLRRFGKKANGREFVCDDIPTMWAGWIKAEIEGADKKTIEAAFDDWIKAISTRERAYQNILKRMIAEARGGNPLPKARFRSIMLSESKRFGSLYFSEGLIDGGVPGGVPDAEESAEIKAALQPFTAWVGAFTNALYSEQGITDSQAKVKPGMWNNKLMVLYQDGLVAANGNQMLLFTGRDGDDSCITCRALKGQVHRAKEWKKRGLRPGIDGDNYQCGAWQCHHVLLPTTRAAKGSFPSNAQVNVWAATKADYVCQHNHGEPDFDNLPFTRAQYDEYFATEGYTVIKEQHHEPIPTL